MPNIIVTGIYQASTAEVDGDSETGLTEAAFDELFNKLDEAGLTSIDMEPDEG